MSVILTTSLGDITVDLHTDRCPLTTKSFLKLCKIKYFNGCLFHTVQKDFTAQTGDPTGKGTGGDSIYKFLYGDQARFFGDEIHPDLKHSRLGTVAMASGGENLNASQFYITLREDLDYLDGKHTVFGQVEEGFDVLTRINEAYVDEKGRPYKNIRIKHTYVIDDPFDDPSQLAELIPDRSPEGKPSEEIEDVRLEDDWVPMDEKMNPAELEESIREREAHTHAVLLETMGDIPDAEIKPPENVLFVCKLNPVTQDEDLDTIFSRFGNVLSSEIIRDYKTADSLCYAFIEFETNESCEQAYYKMDNALIDDRRIHVDFSQSVAKLWSSYRRAGRGQTGKERGCFKCGELGHVAKDCEENSNGRGQSSKYILKDENRQHGGSNQSYEMVFDEDNLENSKSKPSEKHENVLEDDKRKSNKDYRVPEHRQHRGHEQRGSASDGGKQSDRSRRYREEERIGEHKKIEQKEQTTKHEHQKREYDFDRDVGRRKTGHEDRNRKYMEEGRRTDYREDDKRQESGGSYKRDERGYRKRSMDDKDHQSMHGSENGKGSRKRDDSGDFHRRDDSDYSKRIDNDDRYYRRHERDDRRREDHDCSRRR
ncbi:peptidyl-prolyl cis-trans isomerase CYP59 [Aristolochia californica]|uniref:peptidyl-prolyl cis-trans isomerase CYP59 n=1 Tax=Aristolochia californica TaxID=171875 RepID=UPI0035DE2FFC